MGFTLAGHSVRHDLNSPTEASATQPRPTDEVFRALTKTVEELPRNQETSVSLVLKPDAATQLTLHLKSQQDHFEAVAILERGDLAALGAEWSQLQHRLAEQGVRLAPLTSTLGHSMSFAGGQSFARQDEPNQPFPNDPFLPARPQAQSPKAGVPVSRAAAGTEWWA